MADYTPNYQLHQWVAQDPFLRTDFNTDLQKIDTALGDLAEKDSTLQTLVSKCGNCRVYETSYVGKGGSLPEMSIQFPWLPVVVIIMGEDGYTMITHPGQKNIHINPSSVYTFEAKWSETTLSWETARYGADRMNETDVNYKVVALGITA